MGEPSVLTIGKCFQTSKAIINLVSTVCLEWPVILSVTTQSYICSASVLAFFATRVFISTYEMFSLISLPPVTPVVSGLPALLSTLMSINAHIQIHISNLESH